MRNFGKARTTNEQNIILQRLFIEKGFRFFNGRDVPHDRDDLDFFYFDKTKGIISLGSKSWQHSNCNYFKQKYWSGEQHFIQKRYKELSFEDVQILINNYKP